MMISATASDLSRPDLETLVLGAVECLPAGILVYGQDGVLEYINPRGSSIFGSTPERLCGKRTVQDLFGLIPHLEAGSSRLEDPHPASKTVLELVPEEPRTLGFHVQKIGTGPDAGYVVLFQDITVISHMRQQRERHLQLASLAHLLPTIAHEIKNPLAGIRSIVEVIKEETTSAQHQSELELVVEEVGRLQQLVDGMGLAERDLTAGAPLVDVAAEISRCLRFHRRRAEHLGIDLRYSGEPSLIARLRPDLLELVLTNLIYNALDVCQRGDSITVSLDREGEMLRLAVADTGRGMSPETLERATQPLFTTKRAGTGIGLALVQEVVRRSGGDLDLCSQEGVGTSVTLRLQRIGE